MESDKDEIVIIIEGGCLQDVFVSDPSKVKVILIDYDAAEERGTVQETMDLSTRLVASLKAARIN